MAAVQCPHPVRNTLLRTPYQSRGIPGILHVHTAFIDPDDLHSYVGQQAKNTGSRPKHLCFQCATTHQVAGRNFAKRSGGDSGPEREPTAIASLPSAHPCQGSHHFKRSLPSMEAPEAVAPAAEEVPMDAEAPKAQEPAGDCDHVLAEAPAA